MKHNATTLSWMGALTLMVFVLLNTGCSKDFLDRDPYIGSSAGNFYQTAEDARQPPSPLHPCRSKSQMVPLSLVLR